MNTSKLALSIILLIAVAVFSASCSSSRKFDYASAYKFRYHQAAERTAETYPAPEESALTVSVVPESVPQVDLSTRLKEAEERILAKSGLSAEEVMEMSPEELDVRLGGMSRSDKTALRKNLRQELKAFDRKEIKALNSNSEIQATQTEISLTGYTKTGAIVGGLGVILLILGAIFSDVLLFFGVGLVLAGVVFILIDLL